MSVIKQGIVVIGLAAIVAIQGCSLAPVLPDPEQKNAALERWNRCLQRFESNIGHFCDGHRRDVLAVYPAHQENQVDALLSQQSRVQRASSLLNSAIGYTMDASSTANQDTLMSGGSRAE